MRKKKILLVDDEVDMLEILKARFEVSGYEVTTANNGKEALGKIKKDKPDAVVMDIMMPEMDGISVLKEIRRTDSALPVFFITAFSNEERVKIASDLNASGFIVKTQDLASEVKNIASIIDIADKAKRKSG